MEQYIYIYIYRLTPEDVTSSTIKQFATDAFEVGKEAAIIAKEKLDNFGVTSKVKTAGEFIVNRTNSAANKIGNISHEIRGNETIQGMGEGAVDTITGAAKKMKNVRNYLIYISIVGYRLVE